MLNHRQVTLRNEDTLTRMLDLLQDSPDEGQNVQLSFAKVRQSGELLFM